ncbi:hypothetical protein [Bacteroides sp. UBA939]|uniref:hypothetical protein n=1 Tax=Bacteroides sp. UBA939 TaxID=1946092 RepID=UPI0025BC30A4|nr:hypothetical protein [Bacteroides sp. UBA939]
MGYYKNSRDARSAARRYNAAKRKQDKLSDEYVPRLIRLESMSETERYTMVQDADRMTEYNNAIIAWQHSVAAQLRREIASRSRKVAISLRPNTYTDKYGMVERLGFSFLRQGIYIHKGAGKGQGGYTGSKWYQIKRINGTDVMTAIVRHTNPNSLGKQGESPRETFEWFDPIIKKRLPELSDIVLKYFDTMLIDATKIYIDN